MRIDLLAVLGLVLLALTASAAPAVAQPTNEPVEITADEFVIEENDNRAEFIGNVVVVQADLTVWADRVIVNYRGSGGSDIENFEALGNVRIRDPEQDATGERGVYDPNTRILTLTGNVEVTNSSGTVTAPALLVDLDANTSRFSTPGGGGRVTGVFAPNE